MKWLFYTHILESIKYVQQRLIVAVVKLKRGGRGAIRAAATVCDQEQTSHMELISTMVMSQAVQTREFWGNLGFPGHKLLSG